MNACELTKLRDESLSKHYLFDTVEKMIPELVRTSLSFEQTTSEDEVNAVLSGNVIGIDPEKVQNIINQKNAFLHIIDMVKNNKPMTESELKDLHQILMEGINTKGGLYRNVDISINGSHHTPPSYIKVYDRMGKYFDYLEAPFDDLITYISYTHLQLAKIHPFLDGNGRCARLVLNYELMIHGFLPISILPERRREYFETLESFKVDKDPTPFHNFLIDLEAKALKSIE